MTDLTLPQVKHENDMYYMAMPVELVDGTWYQSYWSSDGKTWHTDGTCYEHAHHAIGHAVVNVSDENKKPG